jgi:dipeptidyl aminopeptidase/acylaminoacyl peptidase
MVLIALHGGPISSWRATFDPLFAELAQAGIAVVAPNIRGSTGYGRDHLAAIRNNWGGPDCDDIIAIGNVVATMRGGARPVVLGFSYGAYLALLAAQRAPQTWSGCAALAPFISGARIVAAGGPVAELVRRLGGADSPDVRAGLAKITVPVLIMHGTHDHTVPPIEAQLIADQLRSQGCPVDHHVIHGGGHDLVNGPYRRVTIDGILDFCHTMDRSAMRTK